MHWKDLLNDLACPACKGPLTLKVSAGSDALKCSNCHRVYPVRDDIPILLVDQSKIEN